VSEAKTDRDAVLETNRKVDAAIEWLELQAALRTGSGCFGRTLVEMIWEKGAIRRVKLADETLIEDLTDGQRAALRLANKKPENPRQELDAVPAIR